MSSVASGEMESITSTAQRTRALRSSLRGRIRLELKELEAVGTLISMNYILTVLLESVELGVTSVDQALVDCTLDLKWINRVWISQLRAGVWMAGQGDKL